MGGAATWCGRQRGRKGGAAKGEQSGPVKLRAMGSSPILAGRRAAGASKNRWGATFATGYRRVLLLFVSKSSTGGITTRPAPVQHGSLTSFASCRLGLLARPLIRPRSTDSCACRLVHDVEQSEPLRALMACRAALFRRSEHSPHLSRQTSSLLSGFCCCRPQA